MTFKANGKEYPIDEKLRNQIKAGWQEMLKPARERDIKPDVDGHRGFVVKAESELKPYTNLLAKDILEVGCAYGERSYLMARYQDTKVHGIDIDEYIAEQSPDLNAWNPKDVEFVHNKLETVRKELTDSFPKCVSDKVTFETSSMENYATSNPHDLIVSWDVLEHIIDLPVAFNQMANALKTGGIAYHEYNPFFAINGGHSLCTLDFLFGHCVLGAKDFERYIRDFRPQEEKIDLNFYHKCLNRATRLDIKNLAEKHFEILEFDGKSSFGNQSEDWKEDLEKKVLPIVQQNYPTATISDLMCDSVHIILRKK